MSIIEKVLNKLETEGSQSEKPELKPIHSTTLKEKKTAESNHQKIVSDKKQSETATDDNVIELNFEQLGLKGFLTPQTVNITLSEQFRRIKMPILSNAFGRNKLETERSNLVMVTSSIQNEGKSFTSFNLAMSIAKEFNHTVLYIDADITQRMMDSLFKLGTRAGLVDLLLDNDKDMSELLLKTNVPRLTLLPSGRAYDRVTELWASLRMTELMNELSQRYHDRLIIFDTPPLLQDSSAEMLAKLVGQIIVVIEAEKTPRHIIEEAVNLLEGPQYVGLLLNKSNQRETADYGYYSNN